MGFLQNAVIAAFIFLNTFVSGALGVFHLSQPQAVPLTQTTATTTKTIGTSALPTTLTSVGIFSKDNSHVYDPYGNIISAADPATFTLCNSRYDFCAKDIYSVYVEDGTLAGADPQTFKVLNHYYGKDKNSVFLLGGGEEGPQSHIIVGADANSFDILPWKYATELARDNERVYVNGFSLTPPIDPKTVSVIGGLYLRDAYHVYFGPVVENWRMSADWIGDKVTIIPEADPQTFVLLQEAVGGIVTYGKDASHIYYGDKILSGVDYSSFHIVGGATYDAQDIFHKYLAGVVEK